ncbi:MAG: terminase family protein [Candidatus Levyibacteriota bacterium]
MENIVKVIINYTPLPYQQKLHDDQHRFRTIVAGRRAGKTTFSVNELLKLAFSRNLQVPYWYVAPYYHQAKTIAWDLLLKYTPKELWKKKPNENELTLQLINGAKIVLKGADNPLSLEGIALGGLIVDEVAAIPHFQSLWEKTLRPMLSDHQSPAIFISKPRGYNIFHTLAKLGDHNGIIEGEAEGVVLDEDFITYRYETEQNCKDHNGGYIRHEEIEAARRQLTEDAFSQEYLAMFTKFTGLVHKLFSRETHIIPFFEIPKDWRRIRGWDFGSSHPTASLRIAIDPDDNWLVEICYKKAELSIDQHVENIQRQDYGFPNVYGYGDPSGAQWIREFKNKGINIEAARKDANTSGTNWLQLGIDQINQKLQPREGHTVILPNGKVIENAPTFFILRTAENQLLIEELETLSYKEATDGTNSTILDDTRDPKGHFDLLAALRYAVLSYKSRFSWFPIETPEALPQSYYQEKDREIKEVLKDPEKLKKLEMEADLKLIAEQNERAKNGWW